MAPSCCAIKDGDNPEHVAQRARDEKARQQPVDATVAGLVEAGVTVIDRPGYENKTIKELREIRMVKKNGDPKVNPPTEKEHASCPGHAAYVTAYYRSDPQVTYVCTDPKGNGHALYSWSGQTVAPSEQPGGGMTDEQKAERKALIANNKRLGLRRAGPEGVDQRVVPDPHHHRPRGPRRSSPWPSPTASTSRTATG